MAKDTDVVDLTPQIDGTPIPAISEPPAGQTLDLPEVPAVTLEGVLASPELQALIDKQVQSKTDSRLGTYGTRLDTVEGTIAHYEAEKGGTVDKAALSKLQGTQREQELLARVESLEGGKAVAPLPGGDKQLLTEKQASILSEVGMTSSDPRFIEFLRDNPKFSSNEEYFAALDKQSLVWQSKEASKPVPSDSSVAQIIPSVPTGDGKYSEETYKKAVVEARGKPGKIDKIRDQALADGVDVYNISFELP